MILVKWIACVIEHWPSEEFQGLGWIIGNGLCTGGKLLYGNWEYPSWDIGGGG